MEITWSGRAYVNEEQISPEQYKVFFDKAEFGIKFNVANQILGTCYREGSDEVVPCDELNYTSREKIKCAISMGETSGCLYSCGERLHWEWEPKLTSEGDSVALSELDKSALFEIAKQMLDKMRYCGIIET